MEKFIEVNGPLIFIICEVVIGFVIIYSMIYSDVTEEKGKNESK